MRNSVQTHIHFKRISIISRWPWFNCLLFSKYNLNFDLVSFKFFQCISEQPNKSICVVPVYDLSFYTFHILVIFFFIRLTGQRRRCVLCVYFRCLTTELRKGENMNKNKMFQFNSAFCSFFSFLLSVHRQQHITTHKMKKKSENFVFCL